MKTRSSIAGMLFVGAVAIACGSSGGGTGTPDAGSTSVGDGAVLGALQDYQPACQEICNVAKGCGWTSGGRPNCANLCAASMIALLVTVEGAGQAAQCYKSSSCDVACNTCGFSWC